VSTDDLTQSPQRSRARRELTVFVFFEKFSATFAPLRALREIVVVGTCDLHCGVEVLRG